MLIEKYSFGIGDRFSRQGTAQLKAIIKASEAGIGMVPVWNKSNREHQIIGSSPSDTRREADEAVEALGWKGSYYVDADHINLKTVDRFMEYSDFFTLDVADSIGKGAPGAEISAFLKHAEPYLGTLDIPGIQEPFAIDLQSMTEIATKYLGAVRDASAIYRHVVRIKGHDSFVAEVSMDEVDHPQTPVDLFFILLMISYYDIPAQTIAPKFTGRFNKGVDYVGNLDQFSREFEQDLLVIDHAVRSFGLPGNLKLSIHSGSDKFSLYPLIGRLLKKHDKGIHVKTAGTTWLEELIGLAMAGGEALSLVKKIYGRAHERLGELCAPYAAVIDIDPDALPLPGDVNLWDGGKLADTLRHVPDHPDYHAGFRQLLHVGYKVAAEMGTEFLTMLERYRTVVEEQVTTNIYDRHIRRLFDI